MNFLRSMLSEGGTQPSTTRVCLMLAMVAACMVLSAWTWGFVWSVLRCGTTPDIPGGVVALATLILSTAAGLKGWEKTQQKEGKQE